MSRLMPQPTPDPRQRVPRPRRVPQTSAHGRRQATTARRVACRSIDDHRRFRLCVTVTARVPSFGRPSAAADRVPTSPHTGGSPGAGLLAHGSRRADEPIARRPTARTARDSAPARRCSRRHAAHRDGRRLAGSGRSRPRRVHRGAQLLERALVDDHHVRHRAPLLVGGLRRDPGTRLLLASSPGRRRAGPADLLLGEHHDHQVVVAGQSRLDQQRHVVAPRPRPAARRRRSARPLAYPGMDDALQPAALAVVAEDQRATAGRSSSPAGSAPRSERRDHLGQPVGAGRDHLAGQPIRVDHHGARARPAAAPPRSCPRRCRR